MTRDRPFFAFVNFMTAHLPRYPREEGPGERYSAECLRKIEPVNIVPERYYLSEYSLAQEELNSMVEIYDEEIRHLDSAVGAIIEILIQRNLLNSTVIIILSDHGENFGDHGYIEHQFCVYNSLIRIPLIIRYPEKLKAETVDRYVSLVDLPDAIMSLTGLSGTDGEIRGESRSFSWPINSHAVFGEAGNAVSMLKAALRRENAQLDYARFDRDLKYVISDEYKLILSSEGDSELFHLAVDFDEKANLLPSEHWRQERLLDLLHGWEGSLERVSPGGKKPVIDVGTEDALRSLGYIE
jgi:arylsulfatase A-like enzyme